VVVVTLNDGFLVQIIIITMLIYNMYDTKSFGMRAISVLSAVSAES